MQFLVNANSEAFGVDDTTGGSEEPDHVELPPWAQQSPDVFIELHREALESDHVSRRLHQWIDLVFGSKQRGAAAEAAANVFHYLSYDGATDIDAYTDAVAKQAAISQLINFGQTPIQVTSADAGH